MAKQQLQLSLKRSMEGHKVCYKEIVLSHLTLKDDIKDMDEQYQDSGEERSCNEATLYDGSSISKIFQATM